MRDIFHVFILVAALSGCIYAQANAASPLSLDITLPPGDHGGGIAYLMFSSADGFPNVPEKSLRHDFVPVALSGTNHQRIDLGSVLPGRYAVAVYLDVNGNRKLDRNFLGIPKEPVGASNNPKVHMGPPHFDECSFLHGSDAQIIPITLVR